MATPKTSKTVHVETVGDPRLGMRIYRSALDDAVCDTESIERAMNLGKSPLVKWSQARVGDQHVVPNYRNVLDCKLTRGLVDQAGMEYAEFSTLYDSLVSTLWQCVNHYCQPYKIKMQFIEAVNFLKYEEGCYLKFHSDHSWAYTCSVSTVSYFNDDYEGGELIFEHLDYVYKPKRGDIFVSPSNFIYSHAATDITKGVKYSAATMFDYNSRFHKYPNGYNEDGTIADTNYIVVD